MREIKLNDSLEVHVETLIEDMSYSHAFGYLGQKIEMVKKFDVVVKTQKGDWVSITHALTEDLYIMFSDICDKHLAQNSEVA